jgi:hypothetical protein
LGELGGVVSYLYWSERRVQRILSDNGIQLSSGVTKFASPSMQGLVPTMEHTMGGKVAQRANIADLIERSLGQSIMSDFDSVPGPRYAKGVGTLVFGEFINDFDKDPLERDRRALIFSSCDYNESDKDSVAICLFGSMENFADYVASSGPLSDEGGWTSSSAPSVLDFLTGKWSDQVDEPSREELAIEALKIANSQGTRDGEVDPLKGWRRSFTYGDIQDVAEWFAEVYLDVDLTQLGMAREDGFRRVVVGAPIWVRTPRIRAVRLYNEYELHELEPPLPGSNDVLHLPGPEAARPLARLARMLRGDSRRGV